MTPVPARQQSAPAWPVLPYRGLSFYGPEDEPLFGGREEDVERCAHILACSGTRVVLLHGRTGCGKSSFLRAGLIPYLERTDAGFEFLTEKVNGKIRAAFVRCTYSPLVTLAEAVCTCASLSYPGRAPGGPPRALPLHRALLGAANPAEFTERVAADPEAMLKSLETIAAILPRTLVIVIDQARKC